MEFGHRRTFCHMLTLAINFCSQQKLKKFSAIDRFWSLTSFTFCWKSFARDINLQLYVHRLITSILCIHLLLYCLLCFIAVSLCQTIQFECTGAPYLYLSRTCLHHDASPVRSVSRSVSRVTDAFLDDLCFYFNVFFF